MHGAQCDPYTFATTSKYAQQIAALRATECPTARKAMKRALPMLQLGFTGHGRGAGTLTGLAQFDIDAHPNPCELVEDLGALDWVRYVGLSASGAGVWGMFQVADPHRHKAHWLAAAREIHTETGAVCDVSVSTPHSLRAASFDPNGILNTRAKVWHELHELPRIDPAGFSAEAGTRSRMLTDGEKVARIVARIAAARIDITSSYTDWVRIGGALAGTFGEDGRAWFHIISSQHPKYDQQRDDSTYTALLRRGTRGGATLGALFHLARLAGISYL